MIWKAPILLGLAICVLGDLHATSEQKVIIRHKKISHDGHGRHDGHDDHNRHDGHDGHDGHDKYDGHDRHDGHDGHDDHDKHDAHDKHDHHEAYDKYEWSYPSYEFAYKVDDPHTGDKKGHEEKRDGDVVKGEYWLMQPDGRKRIVTYYVDKKSGFKADVKYIGHAKHDKDHKKSHHIPHYPKVEHKLIKVDYKKIDDKDGHKVEDHEEKDMKMYYHDDKHGYPSEEKPFIDFFGSMPYKRPLTSGDIKN